MLFASAVFGTKMFGGGSTIATAYSTDKLVFEGFSLSDGTTMVMTDLQLSGPSRKLVGGGIPRGDGEYVTEAYFRQYTIEAKGIVKKSTAALLDAQLDAIRKALSAREGDLDIIDTNNTVKRFVATVDNFDEMFASRARFHITYCPWIIRFKCKTPFGKARSYTSYDLTFSTSPTSQGIVNTGTYKAFPVFVLVFTAASSITGITIANSTTGESIAYSGSVAAMDVFIFDHEAKAVTKNGTAVDFTGSFFPLTVTGTTGSNMIATTITGTSFTVDMTSKYRATYL